MNILILEDDPSRIKWFSEEFRNHNLTIVNNSLMAKILVNKISYQLIFLDHDLGGKQMCASDEDSGYSVAKEIATNENIINPLVVVHSWNPVGAKKMIDILNNHNMNCWQISFGSFDITNFQIE